MKKLNLHHLYLFYYIAKYKSITKAANFLEISQPAVSLQIKNFQKECGVQLLDIVDKKIFLTPVGKSLYFKCEELFALKEDAEEIILGNKENASEMISVCTTHPFGDYYMGSFLPGLINKFQDSLRLSITTDSSDQILEKTLELETDLGIVGKQVKHPKLVIKPLLRESLHLICNPQHELANKLIIHPSDLVNHPFVTHEPGSSTRKAIEEYAAKNNIKLNVVDEIYSPRLVADIVGNTNAISIISRHIIGDYVRAGKLKSIPIDGGLFRYFFLIYHKEKYISPVLQQVITALETWCDNYNREILINVSRD
jgi:DNA-binding transcriptional LysR family regulator